MSLPQNLKMVRVYRIERCDLIQIPKSINNSTLKESRVLKFNDLLK